MWLTKTVKTAWSSPHFRSDSSVDARFVVEAVAETGLDRLNAEDDLQVMDVSRWRPCKAIDKQTKKDQVTNAVLEGLLRNEEILCKDSTSSGPNANTQMSIFLDVDFRYPTITK